MRRGSIVVRLVAAVALVLAACGGGDESSRTSDAEPDQQLDGGVASGGAAGTQIASIWPLPPSEDTATVTVYSRREQDNVISEQAAFELMGTDLPRAVAFYTTYFDQQGIQWTEFEAGTAVVLALTYPERPGVTAVVQIGAMDGGVSLSQERSEVGSGSTPLADAVDPDDPQGDEGPMAESDAPDTSQAPDVSEPPPATEGALLLDGERVAIAWRRVNATYVPATGGDDPFFHIHTSNEADGFYLSFEFYTVWGQTWAGETGMYDIACQDPLRDTGICVHFDPDGPGPAGDLGADFGARGTVVIRQLDSGGYAIDVIGLAFTDGTTFEDFTMSSEPGDGSE